MPVVRPLLKLSLLLSLSASPLFATVSYADDARRSYQVPAGSLSAALTRFAGLAGVNLSVDPALVSGRSSSGLAGEYGVEEGFARLLQGSGLQLQAMGEHAYMLVPVPDGSTLELAPTSILGTTGLYDGDTYAGGQVARRGAQGMLGTRDFMETPFSITTYTATSTASAQPTKKAMPLTRARFDTSTATSAMIASGLMMIPRANGIRLTMSSVTITPRPLW